MSDLRALAERLEKATAADREIDAEIARALECESYTDPMPPYGALRGYKFQGGEFPFDASWWPERGNFPPTAAEMVRSLGHKLPAYTSSLDAAVALCERALPGWLHGHEHTGDPAIASAWVRNIYTDTDAIEARGYTPALALCLAVVRAKMQERIGDE